MPFHYVKPRSLEEACTLLAGSNGGGFVLAGGTDLLLRIERQSIRPELVIDIKGLSDLHAIRFDLDGGLHIGSTITMSQLLAHNDVRRHFPLLTEACLQVGSPQIRNRATVGGNICCAKTASDLAPALLCYDAICRLAGPKGQRSLPLLEICTAGGGAALRSGEILAQIVLPTPWAEAAGAYRTVRQGKGGHQTLAGAAAFANAVDGEFSDWRIALTAVGPHPFRALAAETLLNGPAPSAQTVQQAAALAQTAAAPPDDVSAGSAYRRAMTGVLVRRSIEAVLAQLGRGAS